jgi:hypothetical protein
MEKRQVSFQQQAYKRDYRSRKRVIISVEEDATTASSSTSAIKFVHFPPQVLALIVNEDNVQKLWACGNKLLNAKLQQGGMTCLKLTDQWLSKQKALVWPTYMLSYNEEDTKQNNHLLGLRHFKLRSDSYARPFSPILQVLPNHLLTLRLLMPVEHLIVIVAGLDWSELFPHLQVLSMVDTLYGEKDLWQYPGLLGKGKALPLTLLEFEMPQHHNGVTADLELTIKHLPPTLQTFILYHNPDVDYQFLNTTLKPEMIQDLPKSLTRFEASLFSIDSAATVLALPPLLKTLQIEVMEDAFKDEILAPNFVYPQHLTILNIYADNSNTHWRSATFWSRLPRTLVELYLRGVSYHRECVKVRSELLPPQLKKLVISNMTLEYDDSIGAWSCPLKEMAIRVSNVDNNFCLPISLTSLKIYTSNTTSNTALLKQVKLLQYLKTLDITCSNPLYEGFGSSLPSSLTWLRISGAYTAIKDSTKEFKHLKQLTTLILDGLISNIITNKSGLDLSPTVTKLNLSMPYPVLNESQVTRMFGKLPAKLESLSISTARLSLIMLGPHDGSLTLLPSTLQTLNIGVKLSKPSDDLSEIAKALPRSLTNLTLRLDDHLSINSPRVRGVKLSMLPPKLVIANLRYCVFWEEDFDAPMVDLEEFVFYGGDEYVIQPSFMDVKLFPRMKRWYVDS